MDDKRMYFVGGLLLIVVGIVSLASGNGIAAGLLVLAGVLFLLTPGYRARGRK